MSDEGATFDPYDEWLGIPPSEQPPDHYRLLGLERFESDTQVLECAVDRQLARVRSIEIESHSDGSERLLAELAQARACLLNVVAKNAYDAGLRQVAGATADKCPPKPLPDIGPGHDKRRFVPSVRPSIDGSKN